MLRSYPIKFNNVAIPFPKTWNENPQKITNTFDMENGGLNKIVVRTERKAVNASFVVSSRWLKKFKDYRAMNSITVDCYDASTNAYKSHTMFIVDESFNYDLIPNSDRVRNTNGLWTLSFDLEEF